MCLHAYIFNLFRDRAMPRDDYVVRVSVDGVPIPDQSICKGVEKSVHCSFYVSCAAHSTQTQVGTVLQKSYFILTLSLLRLGGGARRLSRR